MDDSERSYGYSTDIYHGRRGAGGQYQPEYLDDRSSRFYPDQPHFERSYEYGPEHRPSVPRRDSYGPEEEAVQVHGGRDLRPDRPGTPLGNDFGAGRLDWDVEGPHRGSGPRGYQRSDERVREDVCERLSAHGRLDCSDIEVSVDGGEVTLEGTVANRRSKRLAEDLADGVRGIVDVHNRLTLGGRGGRRGRENGPEAEAESSH
jgi:hypothetical protein